MTIYLVKKVTGEHIGTASGGGYNLDALPEDVEVVTDTKPDYLSYWDFDSASWVGVGEQPHPLSEYDTLSKSWVILSDLTKVKEHVWVTLKGRRDIQEHGGFAYKGMRFDSDTTAQNRITHLYLMNVSQLWTLQDNSTYLIDVSEIPEIYQTMLLHISSNYRKFQDYRDTLGSLTSVDEVIQFEKDAL